MINVKEDEPDIEVYEYVLEITDIEICIKYISDGCAICTHRQLSISPH